MCRFPGTLESIQEGRLSYIPFIMLISEKLICSNKADILGNNLNLLWTVSKNFLHLLMNYIIFKKH